MTLFEFLAPLRRRALAFVVIFVLLAIGMLALTHLLPDVTKTTLYFSVKPVGATEQTVLDSGVEDAEKVAEAIAGWAKDPAFRLDILKSGDFPITNFKRKLSARKQNRMNVFWTAKLYGDEAVHADALAAAIGAQVAEKFEKLQDGNVFAFELTTPRVYHERQNIPLLWLIPAIAMIALGLAGAVVFLWERCTDRVSFLTQVFEIFPESPVLREAKKIGNHDAKQIEMFVGTFDSPRLLGTFESHGKFFELAPLDSIDDERDTPILLVRLGHTRIRELHNLHAIFGDGVGIIVFEN